jgi:hypothetical protein
MADKHLSGHGHCETCGACLLQTAQIHRCPRSVRFDILASFLTLTAVRHARSTYGGRAAGDADTGAASGAAFVSN